MVNKAEKIIGDIVLRDRVGTLLIWLGILMWVPFLFLRAMGEKPSFLFFLPFHLLGVIGGSRLRSMARRELGMSPPKKSFLPVAGHIMILLGILVWAPYLYLKIVMEQTVDVMNYLPFHLTGVLGGVTLHLLSSLTERHRKVPRSRKPSGL